MSLRDEFAAKGAKIGAPQDYADGIEAFASWLRSVGQDALAEALTGDGLEQVGEATWIPESGTTLNSNYEPGYWNFEGGEPVYRVKGAK